MLILCPNTLKRTWATEAAKVLGDVSTRVIEGGRGLRRRAISEATSTLVIINYESARVEVVAIQAFLHRTRSVLVMDESHYIKNYRSLCTMAVERFAPLVNYRWLLTGTPITNRPTDIYPQICVACAGHPLGSYAAFGAQYADRDPPPPERRRLSATIEPYVLRRLKEDCLDLPPRTISDLTIDLPAWQRQLYDSMRDSIADETRRMSAHEFAQFAPTALVRLLRLSQLASNPALMISSERRTPGKITHLDHLLEDLVAGGRKVVVWSYYVATIELLKRRYGGLGAVALHGATPVEARASVIDRFRESDGANVLVANPATAGTGLTLTMANYVIYETVTWRYDHYTQSLDRTHRIGQHLPVTCIRLLAADTIEFAIAEALSRKAKLARDLLDDYGEETEPVTFTRASFRETLQTGRLPG